MRHAILGAGGIGGLLAGALARVGEEVVLLLRPETVGRFPGRLRVESHVLGNFEVTTGAASALERDVDVLWVATKATQLESALELAAADVVGDAVVIPLLNGLDHVALLRQRYTKVVAAAIRVEAERTDGWLIRQTSPFLRLELAGARDICEVLCASGIDASVRTDETTLLWDKLVFLAPIALSTTARQTPLGAIRGEEAFVGCRSEAIAVAQAEGAVIDGETVTELHNNAPESMRSSMQKDVAAGRPPELDAIAGPILKGGRRHQIETGHTQSLVDAVRARTAGR